jgi:hypothetical protein
MIDVCFFKLSPLNMSTPMEISKRSVSILLAPMQTSGGECEEQDPITLVW